MKSHNNKFLCGALTVVWLLIFTNLTPIVLSFKSLDLNLSTVNLEMGGKQVHYWIDSLNINDNLYSEVYLLGWAFIDTEEDNVHKNVKLILASNENVYEKDMDLFMKGGLASALLNNSVPPDRTAITTTFSPLGIKNGDYFLYIYVYENEGNVGIVNTGKVFHKGYQSFFEMVGGQKLENAEFDNVRASAAVKYNFDACIVSGGKVKIEGWAFLEDTEASETLVNLEVKKPDGTVAYYSTQKINRVDVAKHFNDDRYTTSGFRAELPITAIGLGENSISVIISTEYRSSGKYTFVWDGKESQQ